MRNGSQAIALGIDDDLCDDSCNLVAFIEQDRALSLITKRAIQQTFSQNRVSRRSRNAISSTDERTT